MLKLKVEEAVFIRDAINNTPIKGQDALFVSELLQKITKEAEKLLEKETSK